MLFCVVNTVKPCYYIFVRLIQTLITKKGERYEKCTKKEEPPERVLLRNQSEILDLRVSHKVQR